MRSDFIDAVLWQFHQLLLLCILVRMMCMLTPVTLIHVVQLQKFGEWLVRRLPRLLRCGVMPHGSRAPSSLL